MTAYPLGSGIRIEAKPIRGTVTIEITEEELARNPVALAAARALVREAGKTHQKKLPTMQPTQPTRNTPTTYTEHPSTCGQTVDSNTTKDQP